jgi:hypothetical protein
MNTTANNQPQKRSWRVVETFGPAQTHGGFKNWQLCLCPDGIVAIPMGLWPTIAAGVAAGAGQVTINQSHGAPAGLRTLTDDGDESWRRYPLDQLQSVRVKKPLLGFLGMPELHLHKKGEKKPDLYGVYAAQIKNLRNHLFTLYGSSYTDPGYKIPPERVPLADDAE